MKIKKITHLLNNVHSFDDFAKDHMLAIKPTGLDTGDEELAAVGSRSSIGHGENARLGVLQSEVFVLEFVAVDGLSTGSVVVCEVSSLAHEVRDHSVEAAALVAESFLSCAESTEVLSCLGDNVAPQLKVNSH